MDREQWLNVAAVGVVLVLVVVLGGIAARRVSERNEALRSAAPASAEGEAPPGPGPTDDVALVGDSITEGTEATFHRVLDPTYHVRVRGRGGYRIEEMEPYAIELATAQPEQVVINLGTNDVLKNWPIDKSVTALNRMIKDFSHVHCLHIVTLNEGFYKDSDPDVGGRAAVFNLELRQIAKANNIDVIDWSGAVVADEAAGWPKGNLLVDTVHPTEVGQQVLADLYKQALDDCR